MADLMINIEIVDDVALFLHGLLQRGEKLSIDQVKEARGAYQLEMGNDWRLIHIEGETWRLWSRYGEQDLIDHILAVTRWHFSIEKNINGEREKGISHLHTNPHLGSSFDNFLIDEGIKEDVDENAARKVAAWRRNKR